MATKGWVFVLLVIATDVTSSGTSTSPSDSPAEHGCMDGLRHAVNNGHAAFIFKDVLSGHWNPPSRASMDYFQLSMDRQKNSLSAVGALLDKMKVKDCGEIYLKSKGPMDSGIYTIYPRSSDGENNSAPLRVFCRVEAGRAWTVIQRRQDGSVDFYNRTWEEYSRGFGNLTGEFWLGNDNIHVLTNQGRYKLYMDFEKFDGAVSYSEYTCFRVENKQARYKLLVGSHSGTAPPSVLWRRGGEFTMWPACGRPGIKSPSASCYQQKMGGFWRGRCDNLNPNGFYWKKAEDCPKQSRYKTRGILNAKFIEMRISVSDNTSLNEQRYNIYCK
ncbi:fibrinogen-like protein 1 [Branchiostoma lanceolatum]|uniref:fibrinogen-like protein 1 n=1 Tax=Branchiostoma lanceolatum TaxID=7740 RepID=UPI003455F75C